MEQLFQQTIYCPYCGEGIEVQVDISSGEQAYIEDCQVCCRPIELDLKIVGVEWDLLVRRDDD